MALPDCHSGYGFAIGNVAAFDMADPESIVSPGGVGFDINCGVRLLRTNLTEVHFDSRPYMYLIGLCSFDLHSHHIGQADVGPVKEQLAQSLFDHIPVGVGSKGVIPTTAADLDEALEMGMDWSVRSVRGWTGYSILLTFYSLIYLLLTCICLVVAWLTGGFCCCLVGFLVCFIVCYQGGVCVGRGQGTLRGIWTYAQC